MVLKQLGGQLNVVPAGGGKFNEGVAFRQGAIQGLPGQTDAWKAPGPQKERGDGGCVSYARLAFAPLLSFSASVNTGKRGSQLLHKYDEQAAHPESFQRISNLSGKLIQVKWQAYWYRNVL